MLNLKSNKVRKVNSRKITLKVIQENDNIAIDLNTDEQLGKRGIDSTGKKLPTPYAPLTIAIKKATGRGFGSVTDHITLYGEGDFHKAWFLDAKRFPTVFGSKDPKADELAREWGKDIFGLTKQNEDAFIKEIEGEIYQELQKAILSQL